jgi:16S rRNA (uracil1498-N3)-methyltransferase
VTAPLFLVARGSLDQVDIGGQVLLEGAEARHAVQVRRIGVGERVDLADGAGQRAEGIVTGVDPSTKAPSLVLEVAARSYDAEPAPRFVLVQALAKGDRDVTAIEAATELGVDAIVPWQAERSIVVWRPDRAAKSRDRWAATVLAAAKQSRRSRVPTVDRVCDTAAVATLITSSALTLLLHEEATEPLSRVELPTGGDVLLVVGPEGGVSAAELDRLEAAGAVPVRLGSSVLRSSTAGPAALAVLSARGRWA